MTFVVGLTVQLLASQGVDIFSTISPEKQISVEVLNKFIKSALSKEIRGGLDKMKAAAMRIKKVCLNSKSVHGLYHVQQKRE